MSNLAQTYYDQRLLDKAEALQLEVLENWRNAFGEAHPDVLKLMGNLAQTYCRQKRWKEAGEIERNVLARRETQGKTKPSTLDTMARLAVIYTHQQRWKEAEELEVEILVRRGEAAGKTQAPPNVRPTLGAAAASEVLL
jgi:tetratricopeptide (TPR) repeat protein